MSIKVEITMGGMANAVRNFLNVDSPALECVNAIFTTGHGLDGAIRDALDGGASATGKMVVHLISDPQECSSVGPDRIAIGVTGGRRVHWYDDCAMWSRPAGQEACIVARGIKYACHFSLHAGLLTRHPVWPTSSLRAGLASAGAVLSKNLISSAEPANDIAAPQEFRAEAA